MKGSIDMEWDAHTECDCQPSNQLHEDPNTHGCDDTRLVFTSFKIGGVDFTEVVNQMELPCGPDAEFVEEWAHEIMEAISKGVLA